MKESFKKIIAATGENLDRDGLKRTPERAAAAFEFMTSGYRHSLKDIVEGALFESDNDNMVIVKDIELHSLCEHHLLPFSGKCHVAYLPQGKIIGLSRIVQIVHLFARRLQVQENLTKDIADALMEVTLASGVGVVIEAKHLCMMMPGIEKQNSTTITSVMLGSFRNNHLTRAEFLNLIK